MSLANQITVARILLVPFFVTAIVYCEPDQFPSRIIPFALFLLASLTDALDGYLARVRKELTPLGSFLDPFADKLLLVSAFLCLHFSPAFPQKLPPWMLIVIVSREVLILSGLLIFFFSRQEIKIKPSLLGKTTTVAQMVTVGAMLARFGWAVASAHLAVILTALSGLGYVWREVGRLNHGSPAT